MFYRNYNPLLRWVRFLRGLPLLLVASLILVGVAQAQPVSLGWDADTDPGVVGYRLYYGVASGTYSQIINVGNATAETLPNLQPGTTYYFVVTAYDNNGLESAFSNEASYGVPTPATLSAEDDTVTLTSTVPVIINVLTNDKSSNGSPLTVVSSTTPAYGSATINGSGTITYLPGKAFKGEDSFVYTVIDGNGNSATATVTITEPFLLGKGNFYGLITSPSVNASQSGSIQITLTSTGKFTGHVKLGSHNISLTGTFGLNGIFYGTIAAKGEPVITLNLNLDAVDGTITGSVSSGTFTSSVSADLAGYSSANPAPQAGSYTVLFSPSSEAPTAGAAPQGYGYGRVVVAKTGAAKFVGALGDGTRVGFSVPIARDGSFPFFAALYSGKGSIGGDVKFETITTPGSQSDLNGSLEWIRPPKPPTTSGLFAAGFSTPITLIGSAFIAPTTQNQILSLATGAPNASVILSSGNLPATITKSATLTATNSLIIDNPGADRVSIAINTSTGLFTGTFFDVSSNKTRNLAGALFQKEQIGAGYFLGATSSGSVVISQAP
jgi:Bacterial Ig domain/Fibronectin type III domain